MSKLKKHNHKESVYLVIKEKVIMSGGGEEREKHDGGGN